MLIKDEVWQLYVGTPDGMCAAQAEEIIMDVLERHAEGWTMSKRGYGGWGAKREFSYVVTISTNEGAVRRIIRDLKDQLNQECIGLVKVSTEGMEMA